MKHTSGPWIRKGVGVYSGETLICATGDDAPDIDTVKVQIADAQLISAAPELLECLRGCIGYLAGLPMGYRPDDSWFAPASAAIVKAEAGAK